MRRIPGFANRGSGTILRPAVRTIGVYPPPAKASLRRSVQPQTLPYSGGSGIPRPIPFGCARTNSASSHRLLSHWKCGHSYVDMPSGRKSSRSCLPSANGRNSRRYRHRMSLVTSLAATALVLRQKPNRVAGCCTSYGWGPDVGEQGGVVGPLRSGSDGVSSYRSERAGISLMRHVRAELPGRQVIRIRPVNPP